MKRRIAVFTAVLMIASIFSLPCAMAQEKYGNRGEVAQMLLEAADDYNPQVQKSDIIKGYEDGSLHEDEYVTRAEALVMLKRAFGDFPEIRGNTLRIAFPNESFSDIPKWADNELSPVLDVGIVAGTSEGKFSPGSPVTLDQMETFIKRTYEVYGSNLKDSFYETVNKEILDSIEISAGRSMAGTLYAIDDLTNRQVADLIREIAASEQNPDSAKGKIKALYESCIDMDARNAEGIEPIKADLEAIDNVKSLSELETVMVMDNSDSLLSALASFTIYIDDMDSNKWMTVFVPASASQNKQVYNGQAEQQRKAYLKYLTTIMKLCGEDEKTAAEDAQTYFSFEKALSEASMDPEEMYDIEKTYNIYSMNELEKIFSTVNLEKFFALSGLQDSSRICVMDKGNMLKLAEMLKDENIDDIKTYLKVELVKSCAGYLSEDFRNARITYQKEALGIEGAMTLEEEAAVSVAEMLPDYVGQVYADKYCSKEIIADVTDMIHDIIAVYKKRIAELDWMSEETKEKAVLKLDSMRIKVGAPDYDEINSPVDTAVLKSTADGGSYYKNMLEISKANRKEDARLSREPVDKEQWITTPQTVNAFYMPSFNSISFPMAFLQSPIYDKNASYEENLGSIGTIIGHEITHAFDSSGSQYDENGNAVNWWTDEDKRAFELLCSDVEKFFDGQESAPGIIVDGELTLTENIADLGAISCIVELGSQTKNFDFKKAFEAYAEMWAATCSREYLQTLAYIDVHSPSKIRVNRVLQSVDKFYEVYEIKEGDGMYVAPEDRAGIW